MREDAHVRNGRDTLFDRNLFPRERSTSVRERNEICVTTSHIRQPLGTSRLPFQYPRTEYHALFNDDDDDRHSRRFNRKASDAVTRFFVFGFSALGMIASLGAVIGIPTSWIVTGVVTGGTVGTLICAAVGLVYSIKFMHWALTGKW